MPDDFRHTPLAMQRARIAILLLTASLIGCAAKKHLSADEYFNAANGDFHNGAYTIAIDQFHELLDQYPFSQYSEEAELKIAHAQYLGENYPEAIVAFTDFQRRHPTSPYLPFVGYYLGMCYARQMGTYDRDQGAAQSAENVFLTVIQQFPDSPFADLGREQLGRCRTSLAEHELYIANFYAQRDNTKAAEIRLLLLASRYGDTDTSADGLLRLGNLYRQGQQLEDAALAYRALTQLHPRSAEAAEARSALEQLAAVDPPDSRDPLDILLAANGRQRGAGNFQVVRVPGLDPSRAGHRAPGAAPAMVPPFDPFGRTRPY